MEDMIMFMKLVSEAIIPHTSTKGSAGFDISCIHEVVIQPRSFVTVRTGVAVAIPSAYVGKLEMRSSLAARYGLAIGAGVIDSDYRGELKVLIFNHSNDIVTLEKFSRVAQLLVIPVCTNSKEVNTLDNTERGEGGFGSTGK